MTTGGPGDRAAGEGAGGLAGPIAARLAEVHRRIAKAGGDPAGLRIVAVTKGFGREAVVAARAAGLDDLGENYAQELLAKAAVADPGARWHFLGPVQRNKVAALAPVVAAWHGLDRERALEAVAARAPGATVLVEVNVTGEATRPGCRPEDAGALVGRGRDLGLDVAGLMAVGPAGDEAGSHRAFGLLARLGASAGVAELSMGMSDDFEAAVAEGATILRLGRVLFGPRPERASVPR